MRANAQTRIIAILLLLFVCLGAVMAKGTTKTKLPKVAVSKKEFRELALKAAGEVQQFRAAALINSEAIDAGRGEFTAADGTREQRIARTRDSALEFGRVYLSHYFEEESADFHEALDKLVCGNYTSEDLTRWREGFGIEVYEGNPELGLLAVMVPRGFAKSTIVNLLDNLRRICHGLDPYIILGADTYEQASAQLEDLKEELESNEKIRADFGNLKPDRGVWREGELIQRKNGKVTWREGRVVTTNNVRCDAVSRGGKMRGRKHGRQRPTVYSGDDLDNDENVQTREQREKAWKWLVSAVIPAMDPKRGKVRIIGTNIHFDCVIARAQRRTDGSGRRLFTSIKFAAMSRAQEGDKGAVEDPEQPGRFWTSHWAARFTVQKLLALREVLGPIPFGAEYMNDPRDPDTALFNLERLRFYGAFELEGKTLERILYIDPSLGKKDVQRRKKSDFSGIADGYADRAARVTYLLNAYRKRLNPAALEEEIISAYVAVLRENPDAELWIEENSFGALLGERFQDRLRKLGVDQTVHTFLHKEPKPSRLERLSGRNDQASVRYPAKWEREDRRPEFFSEMEDYPGAYDDTIDAIETLDAIGCSAVEAASCGKDPEGGNTSRDRMKREQEGRFLARLMGLKRAS